MRRLVAAALFIVVAACGGTDAPTPIVVQRVSMSLTDSSSAFGIALLDNLLNAPEASNVFISPLSATIALSMAASAADAGSRAAILKVLGIDPTANADEQARESIARLAQSDPNTQLDLAQAVWTQYGLHLNPAYVTRLKDDYQAELANLDFGSPHAPDVVNAWVSQKTNGMVPKLVEQFPPGTVGYLVNAVYFHSLWAAKFTTTPSPLDFTNFSGDKSSRAAMSRSDTVIVYHGGTYVAALLPYKGGRFSAVVIVPAQVLTQSGFAAFLTTGVWDQTMAGFHAATGDTLNAPCRPAGLVACDWSMTMPKLDISYRQDLTSTLHAMGMPIPGAAMPDFCGGCSIDRVVQATRLVVDEKGTTAAAATGVSVMFSARAPLLVDRPFAFAIVDNATDGPLFLGAIGNLS